jgi:molybdate transport system permease protein
MKSLDLVPILLSFKLAMVSTGLLLVLGIPLAYWLAFTKNRIKTFIAVLVNLPLVLPPTVLGFYLLVLLSPQSWIGRLLEAAHIRLVFNFSGLVIGGLIFSLPFMVNAIKAGFQNFPRSLIEASYSLGKTEWETFIQVILPNMKPSLLIGIIMSFAHTIGEFGVVLMLGGNIPGKTRVASIAIYEEVETLNYAVAAGYSVILVGVCFIFLVACYWMNPKENSVPGTDY